MGGTWIDAVSHEIEALKVDERKTYGRYLHVETLLYLLINQYCRVRNRKQIKNKYWKASDSKALILINRVS